MLMWHLPHQWSVISGAFHTMVESDRNTPPATPVPTASENAGPGKTETTVRIHTQAPTDRPSVGNLYIQVLLSVNNLGPCKPIVWLMELNFFLPPSTFPSLTRQTEPLELRLTQSPHSQGKNASAADSIVHLSNAIQRGSWGDSAVPARQTLLSVPKQPAHMQSRAQRKDKPKIGVCPHEGHKPPGGVQR